ncbi:hypothetical protein [Pseudomonas alkylphenolica]|uniref:hypothetical protein n=1 Tax=Pseudomonas alkylphenolica TaxID=237609 RepID=UPI003D675A1C
MMKARFPSDSITKHSYVFTNEASQNMADPFSSANLARMSKGFAPRAPFAETVTGRRSYEARHLVPTAEGGELYDMNNIRIMTPKQCISPYGDQ